MGIQVIEVEGGDEQEPDPFSDKLPQTEIEPSTESCINVVEELKAARPSGRPILSLVADSEVVDLTEYLFKQQNEMSGALDVATDPNGFAVGDMRPGLYGQRDGRKSERSQEGDATTVLEKPPYFEDMKTVFGNSKYFDLVRNHNQILSTPGNRNISQILNGDKIGLDSATRAIQEKPDEPTTLLNFDSHSDMWSGPVHRGKESIAQWVNGVLRDNPNVNEVYWVIPKDFQDDPELRSKYFDHHGEIPDNDRVFVHAQRDMTLYLNKESGELVMTGEPEDYSEEKYRKIEFHKRTLDELEDFSGKRTVVSIDLDFFDNRGYDTSFEAAVNYKGSEGFAEFVQTLKDRNIRPDFTTVSASPEYVRNDHMRELLRFSSLVAEATDAPLDAVAVPKENQVYSAYAHDGMQVDRSGVKALELFDALFKIDSQTQKPNDALDLNLEGEKLQLAIDATRRIYGAKTEQEAMKILQSLDSADGNPNGILEFEAIESLLVRVCRRIDSTRLKKDTMQ